MRYFPLAAAGALLLAGSMSAYAQQTEERRPIEPDSSKEMRSKEQGGTERRSGGDAEDRNAEEKDRGDSKGAQRDDDKRTGGQAGQRDDDKRTGGQAGQRDDDKRTGGQAGQRDDDKRTGGQAGQRSGSDDNRNRAESEQRSGGSQDNNQRVQQSGGEGGKGKAKQREASSKMQPQQKTVIRERIKERKVKRSEVNFSVSIGSAVPRTVVLYDLPSEIIEIAPAYREYKYVLADDDTIVVIDPYTWEIVDVIEI